MKNLISLILPLLLWLSGCSTQPTSESAFNPHEKSFLWLQHQVAANAIQTWEINGRLVIKNETQNATVNLYWNQQTASYELRLISPFWQGTYILNGSEQGVVMKGPDNLALQAATATELLEQQLGWRVHLQGLKYWIRGLPEPGSRYQQLSLDSEGRLLTMRQSGFDIHIKSYIKQAGGSLPEKITIQNDDLLLKIVIQHWHI